MTDRLILTILIALACPLLLPVVIEEEAEKEAYQRGLNDAREWKASCEFCRFTDVRQDMEPCASCSNNYDNKFEPEEQEEMDGLRQNIQTIVDQCGYTLDEIASVLQKMRES